MKREAIVFYFEYRARIASWKMIARHPRGAGDEEFHGGGAGLVQPESLIRGTRGRENGVLPGCARRKNHVSGTRGMDRRSFSGISRAGRERKFLQARRAMVVQREYKESHPRGAGLRTVPGAGRSGRNQ